MELLVSAAAVRTGQGHSNVRLRISRYTADCFTKLLAQYIAMLRSMSDCATSLVMHKRFLSPQETAASTRLTLRTRDIMGGVYSRLSQ
jgi:hypothetical protein